MENSDDKPTLRELHRAAYVAAQLNEFLERCNRHRVFAEGLLIGYDLDDLSGRFTKAAEKMKTNA